MHGKALCKDTLLPLARFRHSIHYVLLGELLKASTGFRQVYGGMQYQVLKDSVCCYCDLSTD